MGREARRLDRDVRPTGLPGLMGLLSKSVRLLALASIALAVTAIPFSGAARAGEDEEDFDLYYSVEYAFDDNVLLTDSNEEEDSILTQMAGFEFSRATSSQKISIGYQFRWRDYFDRDEFDQPEHAVYLAMRRSSSRLNLSFEDRLLRTEDPAGFEFIQRQKRVFNDAKASARLNMSRGAFTLTYVNAIRDYRQSDWDYLSATENAGSLEVSMPLTESRKTEAFASVSIGRYRFDEPQLNGYRYLRGVVGMRGQPGSKLAFEFGAGVNDLDDFDDNFADDEDSASELFAYARATWRIKPEKTKLELVFRRDDQPSTQSNYQVVTSGGALSRLHKADLERGRGLPRGCGSLEGRRLQALEGLGRAGIQDRARVAGIPEVRAFRADFHRPGSGIRGQQDFRRIHPQFLATGRRGLYNRCEARRGELSLAGSMPPPGRSLTR